MKAKGPLTVDVTRYAISLVLFVTVTLVIVVCTFLALRRHHIRQPKPVPVHISAEHMANNSSDQATER